MNILSAVRQRPIAIASILLLSATSLALCLEAADEPAAPETDRAKLLATFHSEFVSITPGEGMFPKNFTMGTATGEKSEAPAHEVTLSGNFAIAKYEVTQSLYAAVTGRNPSAWKGPRNSVEMVTWAEAERFCQETTKLLRDAKLISDDDVIRLPSEAEWEYCCRAGTTTAYSFGDSAAGPNDVENKASLLDPYGWHTGNAAGNDPPVGAKKPNAWGLYDMHGYLWEFVADKWHADYQGAPANSEPWDAGKAGVPRVIRSGSWRDRHELLRSTTRWPIPDHARSDAVGFRCVKAKVAGRSQ